MKKTFLAIVVTLLCLHLFSQTSDILITVKGFRELKGDIKVGLFKDEETFKKPPPL